MSSNVKRKFSNLGDRWGDHLLIYNYVTRRMHPQYAERIRWYHDVYNDALNCNIWVDLKTDKIYSAAQQIATPQSGRHHSFICSADKFFRDDFSGPPNLRNMGTAVDSLRSAFHHSPRAALNPEIKLCATDRLMKELKNAESAFIIGGGPSTKVVNFKDYDSIPKWTMNNFFENEKINNLNNIKVASFLDDINLDNPKLWDSVKKHNLIVAQEISDPLFGKTRAELVVSKSGKENCTYVITRYRSKLGVGARLVVMAVLLGIKNINICGLDGYDLTKNDNHSFEKSKGIPDWLKKLGPSVQEQQFVIFWDYV